MKFPSILPAVFAAACISAGYMPSTSWATAFTETGDAGDLPSGAQLLTPGISSTDTLTGSLTLSTGGVSESDMYQFTVAGNVSLTASTYSAAFTPGFNNFDSQIAIFSNAGVGLAVNDDATGGGSQSSVTLTLGPGSYYLLISGSGRFAVDGTGALIFPNFTDGTTDATGTYAATSASPITGYTGSSNEGGNYRIALTTVPVVPEPHTFAWMAAGMVGLAVVLRRRAA